MAASMVFIGASVLVTTPAAAVPTVAFSVSSVGLSVGTPASYSADVVCDEPPCRYQWRWYRVLGNDRLGTTMGEGPELTYAFSTPGLKRVVLKVTNATRTHGFAAASQVLRVMTPGDEPVVPIGDEPVTPLDPSDPPVDEPAPANEPAPVADPAVPSLDEPLPGADPTQQPADEPVPEPAFVPPTPVDPPGADLTEPPTAEPTDPPAADPAE
jgi:hypothetical protein